MCVVVLISNSTHGTCLYETVDYLKLLKIYLKRENKKREKTHVLFSEISETGKPKNEKLGKIVTRKISHSTVIMKIIRTKSCGYSYESSHWVLSDEYPFAWVSVIFQLFLHYFILAKLATSSIRVNPLVSGVYIWSYTFEPNPLVRAVFDKYLK